MYYVTNFNSVNDVFNNHRATFTSANNLNSVVTAEQKSESTYPLTNIGYFADSKYVLIEVSLAGFDKDDIKVRYNGSIICIEAEYTDKNICKCSECMCSDELTYIQKNIPTKDINRKIYLNNNYIGAKVRSSFKNGILKILVVPTTEYGDITINGSEQCGKKHKHKPQPQMPQYPFMPYPMVYPMPVMPCPCTNPNGGNGGNGNGGNGSEEPEMIRIDDGDISLIFGDDLNEESNEITEPENTEDTRNSNNSTSEETDEPLSHDDISSLFGD